MSDARELRAALEKAQARVKVLEKERAATSGLQAEADQLRAALAEAEKNSSRVPALEEELTTLRGRPRGRDYLELLAEVNRLTYRVDALQKTDGIRDLLSQVATLREQLASEKEAGAALRARTPDKGRKELQDQVDQHAAALKQLAARRLGVEEELKQVKADRESLAAELTALRAKLKEATTELTALRANLKEITTERNQLRAYAPRR